MPDKTKKNLKYKKLTKRKRKIYGGNPVKTVGIFVAGLGCSMDSYDEYDTKIKETYHFDEFQTYCKQNYFGTLKNIVHTTCLKYIPDNSFVNTIYNTLKAQLDNENTYVYIVGHSYGGAVVATVAKKLQEYINSLSVNLEKQTKFINKLKTYLTICTAGSIYLPTKIQVKDVPLYNYVYKNDISERCWRKFNNVNTTLIDDSFTYYMNADENIASSPIKIHNNYYPLIESIFKSARSKKKLVRDKGSRLLIDPLLVEP